ncbi:MAG: amidohydrolase family protein [Actinomycetota bacterium]|nr:amidohydrolase family protein [Actinomycetota bacterium]
MQEPGGARLEDGQVAEYARSLGIPGLIDIHVHFMPDNVLRKVWAYFETAGPLIGSSWPVAYKVSEPERLERLAAFGVIRHGALNYPHKPGMAEWLNQWSREFADAHPSSFRCATFYPEPSAQRYVSDAIESGAQLFKAHIQVGAYDPRDTYLKPVWGMLAEAGIPVVTHCGSGPAPGAYTGIGPISEVMEANPDLTMIVAHLGNPEYEEFLDLAKRYPRVHLDTTMAFTPFTESQSPFPRHLLPRLAELGDRILLGSDFPNIPYPYSVQISALAELGLGEEWMRAVLYENASRLMGV